MKTSYKCIQCFFRQIEAAVLLAGINKTKKEKLFMDITKKLLRFDFNSPPVVFGKTIYKSISRISGKKDIFYGKKIETERYLARHSYDLENTISESRDSLFTAAKMSCAANAIDFGTGRYPDVNRLLSELKHVRLYVNQFMLFRKMLVKSRSLLILADNCGEAVFDMFFTKEIIKRIPKLNIFYAVRSSPVINDVVISDARRIGINKVAKVISSGCDYPGLILSKTSPAFRRIYKDADIVISKGQGNFESFYDDKKNIFYLFQIKCPAVSELLNIPQGRVLFIYNKHINNIIDNN